MVAIIQLLLRINVQEITLNLQTKGLEMKNITNFENLNFYLQEDTINGDTILTLTDDKGTDISGSNVNVGMAGSTSILQVGDKVNLLTNSNGITADGVTYGRLQQVSASSTNLQLI